MQWIKVSAAFLILSAAASQADAGLFDCFKHQPTCCAPAPTCCHVEPSCCAPAPTCCHTAPSCCAPAPCHVAPTCHAPAACHVAPSCCAPMETCCPDVCYEEYCCPPKHQCCIAKFFSKLWQLRKAEKPLDHGPHGLEQPRLHGLVSLENPGRPWPKQKNQNSRDASPHPGCFFFWLKFHVSC